MNIDLSKMKSKIVPLTFGIFVVTSFMYTYDSNLLLLFFICSILIQGLIYLFYDYISKKNRIMQYVSIIGSLVAMLLLMVIMGSLYNQSNMIDFMVWFLSPQGVVDYSLQYIFVMLIGLNFFVASTMYYFTQVRYRMITTFFLLLIPFAIFTREDKSVPIMFLLPLIVLYFATLIVCGQNNLFKQNNIQIVDSKLNSKSYVKSVGTFILTFMLVASAIPKPQITADRDTFENLINANNFTNYLLAQLGNFTDTSNGKGFSLMSSNRVLFTVKSSETVALKSRTFSNYNFDKNVWLRADGIKSLIEDSNIDTTLHYNDNKLNLLDYDMLGDKLKNNNLNEFQKELNPSALLNAIVFACNKNVDFANKYNLTNIDSNINFQSSVKTVSIEKLYMDFTMLLNPTSSFKLNIDSNSNKLMDFYSTYSGIYYSTKKGSTALNSVNNGYSFDYYSNDILHNQDTLNILSKLDFNMYGDFLNDLDSIVKDSNFQNVVDAYIQDYNNALIYSTIFTDCNNKKILSLAKDITKDCNSDIQKAFALENYFISNNYVYDTDYRQPKDSTIEDFLFKNKTGACYEYSTSMILMARALGLPARYVEGFLIDNPTKDTQPLKVTMNSSHAYPEVYISGYGWCYFEPTQVLLGSLEDESNVELSENYKLFIVSLTIIIIIGLISMFIMFVYPKLDEKLFRRKILIKSLGEALNLIIVRIRKVTKIPDTRTLEELQRIISDLYHFDISDMVQLSNVIFYSSSKMDTSKEKELIKRCLDTYVTLYDIVIQVNKETRKLKRKSKRVKIKKTL